MNSDNSTFPTFEFVRQSYISVTIWLSNKECLKLLLLSISSSRQCNGNVMVNLTQNGQWALSSPPLPLLLSKLLEMRRRFKFDWHKNNSASSCLQSGEKQSSLLRFPQKSKEKSPLISMFLFLLLLFFFSPWFSMSLLQKLNILVAWSDWMLKVHLWLHLLSRDLVLKAEAKLAFVCSCNQRVTIIPEPASYKELQIFM